MKTAPVTFSALDNSPFLPFLSNSKNQRITKFAFDDRAEDALNRAAQAIHQLLKDNKLLCAVFPTSPEEHLKKEIRNNTVLIINGYAICLSDEIEAEDEAEDRKDKFFSLGLLKEPIRCSQGHLLEKKSAEFWVKHKGDVCPEGKHPIGNIEVDSAHQKKVVEYQEQKKATFEENERIIRQALITELEQKTQELNQIEEAQPNAIIPVATLAGKLVIKTTSIIVVKTVTTSALKKIPIIGLVVGFVLGIFRLTQGQYARSIGELTSGLFACFPGMGTGISIGIDVILAACDFGEIYFQNKKAEKQSLPIAYSVLGIDIKKNPKPTKEQVDAAYRKQASLFHPDKDSTVDDKKIPLPQIVTIPNAAKGLIYKANGWT